MSQPSIFAQYIEQFMPMLGIYVNEKVNGKKDRERTYLHKQRLVKVYSPDQKRNFSQYTLCKGRLCCFRFSSSAQT